MLLIYSLGKFTHLPAEKLQFDKKNASRLMMLFGGICKTRPLAIPALALSAGYPDFWIMADDGFGLLPWQPGLQ